MAERTAISWANATFNPWEGCQKTGSKACEHCYAEARNVRFAPKDGPPGVAPNWGPHAPRRRTSAANWRQPLIWDRKVAAANDNAFPSPFFVFGGSLCDVFDNAVDPQWRRDYFDLIRATPHLTWLLLTKRPQNIVRMCEAAGGLPPNAAIGCTVVTQAEADRDLPILLRAKLALRPAFAFVSIEPMMEQLDIARYLTCDPTHGRFNCAGDYVLPPSLDWVICGGESGTEARPMHPLWVEVLLQDCFTYGVPFHFKQWGAWAPCAANDDGDWPNDDKNFVRLNVDGTKGPEGWPMQRVGKEHAGRLIDGQLYDARPKVRAA